MSGMDRLTDEALEGLVHLNKNPAISLSGKVGAMARELLAHRRASQAAPAPSDGLREAAVDALELAHGVSFSKSPTIAQWGQRVEAKLRAALSASPAQEGEPRHD